MSRSSAPLVEVEPNFDPFADTYAQGRAQVVWTRLVADLETPVSAMLKLSEARPMSFLLESVEGGEVRGRYSIIGLEPDIIWRAFGNRAEINRTPRETPASSRSGSRPRVPTTRRADASKAQHAAHARSSRRWRRVRH